MADAESGDVFELDRIRRLIELMKEHDLSEIDLQEDEQRIRLCRGPSGQVVAPVAAATPTAPAALIPEPDSIVLVKSPMVGTFYSKANPNAEPYVKIGDNVEPETTICIVEAMKVFNEIPAEVRGKIVAVLVDDETPVEFGQPLFKVDTSL